MMKIQQEKFFVCQYDCTSHLVRVTFYKWGNGDEELVIAPILNHHLGFWRRLIIAFKYLFKKLHNEWPYDCIMLDRAQAQQLRNFVNDTILVAENIR